MKKGKITIIITIALICFVLATVMSMQFKVVKQTDIASIETMREEELRDELSNWKQLYKQAEEQYNEKIDKLREYNQNVESAEETSELVKKELLKTETYLGKTDLQGEGIEIIIKDANSKDKDEYVEPISNIDLLIIVDYLRLAGAEAISINEERIINTSDIAYINNSIIYVNQQRILAPYIIKAIGDPSKLESTLLGNGGYVEALKNAEFDIEIERNNKISIPKYNKDIAYKYMQ